MNDWIGWIGTSVMAWGSIDIAHKKVRGLWLMAVGNVLFIAVGYRSDLWSLVVVSILMGLLDMYGIYHWRENETTKATGGFVPGLHNELLETRLLSRGRHDQRIPNHQQGLRVWHPPETD